MKDIDFDELDKAVSSVLGQKVQSNDTLSAGTESKSETVTVKTSKKEVPAASMTDTSNRPSTISSGSKRSAPSLATSRRGKFMDVMHPNASEAPSETPAELPARTTHTVEPLNPALAAENKPLPEPVVEPVVAPTAALDESHALIGAEPAPVENLLAHTQKDEPETEAAAEKKEDESDESDKPIEATEDRDTEDETSQAESNEKSEADDEPGIPPSTLASTVPQTTPFLADTKVDKRPLGGFVDSEAATDGDDGASTREQATQTTTASDPQAAPVVPLPRELQSDVIEVETVAETEETSSENPFAATVSAAAEPKDDGRVEGHPLFDATTYHEPIITVHDSSVPTWVKWLLGLAACLALGAGVGYFLFTAGL